MKLDEISSDINIDDFSIKAAEIGNDALSGKDGPAKDTLIYTGALTLSIVKNIDFNDAAEQIKKVINIQLLIILYSLNSLILMGVQVAINFFRLSKKGMEIILSFFHIAGMDFISILSSLK